MALNPIKASTKPIVGVLLDIGNSETRVRIKYRPLKGLPNAHEAVERTFALSNHYAALMSSYEISSDYMNSASVILNIGGIRIAHGELVEREFIGAYEFPSGKNDKSAEPITHWTIQLVLLKTIYLLAEEWGIPVSEVDVAFNVFCLVPPDEHAYNKDGMIKLISDIDEVVECVPMGDDKNYRDVPHEIVCNNIQVFPEGIAAFMGIRVNIDGNRLVPNKDVERFMKGYVLVLDIGAGTTDLAIMQDGVLKADSRQSIADAGNHIVSALMRNIKANPALRGKLSVGLSNLESVMQQAIIYEGDGVINADCTKELNDAKEDLASTLAYQIKSYANSQNIMNLVKGILVVGGANAVAIRDGAVVSPALAEFLIPKIRQFAANAELVPITNRDPRYLNLDGLEAIYITSQANSAKAG